MSYYPYGGLYRPSRNQPVEAPPVNPLPPNKMSNDTGNAGADGYTVVSRADRMTGERTISGPSEVEYDRPRLSEDQ